jgi:hypothetical protein
MFCWSIQRIKKVRMIAGGDIGNSGEKEHRSSSKTAFGILVEVVIPLWPSFSKEKGWYKAVCSSLRCFPVGRSNAL